MGYTALGREQPRKFRKAPFWGLFNVFISDYFFFQEETEVCSEADYIAISACGYKTRNSTSSLPVEAQKISSSGIT